MSFLALFLAFSFCHQGRQVRVAGVGPLGCHMHGYCFSEKVTRGQGERQRARRGTRRDKAEWKQGGSP